MAKHCHLIDTPVGKIVIDFLPTVFIAFNILV